MDGEFSYVIDGRSFTLPISRYFVKVRRLCLLSCENMAGNDSGSHLLGTQAVVSVDQRHTFGRVTLLGEPIGSNDSLSPCNEGGYIISLLKRNCLGG